MKETFALIAAVLAVIGYAPYLKDAITKKVRPHPYTWFIWSFVSGTTLIGQIDKGAGIGAVPTAIAEILTITIFLFSLQYGFRYVRKTDHLYLAAALLGLIPWALTSDPTISVIIAVSIDVIAFTPTIRKTWNQPKSETQLLYASNVVRHILTIASLRSYNLVTMLHSIVMIVANAIMTFAIQKNKFHSKFST